MILITHNSHLVCPVSWRETHYPMKALLTAHARLRTPKRLQRGSLLLFTLTAFVEVERGRPALSCQVVERSSIVGVPPIP
jgi:hypothetical protein